MKKIIIPASLLSLAIYLTWYGVFESPYLPNKIDTHIHLVRIENWLDALRSFRLFPSWHEAPFFGYPEDFNYILTYIPLIMPSLIFGVPLTIKLSFICFFFLAGMNFKSLMQKLFPSEFQAFLAGSLYMGSASFVNFGLGSGSITRMAGIAFFPFLIKKFLDWYDSSDLRSTILFSLIFFSSYLVHPVCALGGVLTFVLIIFIKKPSHGWKAFLIKGMTFALISLPFFSWHLGSLLYAKQFISWDEVYGFYRQFLLDFNLNSFFGFWQNTQERMHHFYMGSFPLILTLLSLFWWRKEKNRNLLMGVLIAVISMGSILAGKYLLKINTYRFDIVFALGTSICASYVLDKVRWKTVSVLIVILIIGEQTWYARPFAGSDYNPAQDISELEKLKQIKLERNRVVTKSSIMNVITRKDLERVSRNNGLHYHGFFELTAGNLGMIPFIREIKNPHSLLEFLGLPDIHHQKSIGIATAYEKFLILKARNTRDSFREIFRPLIENSSFHPSKMPIIFEQAETHPILVSFDGKTMVDPKNNPDWIKDVVIFFEGNRVLEMEELKTVPGKLVILKESYHPRTTLTSSGKMSYAEPGLIAVYTSKDSSIEAIKIKRRFTLIEIFLGLLSLISVASSIAWLLFKKPVLKEIE